MKRLLRNVAIGLGLVLLLAVLWADLILVFSL